MEAIAAMILAALGAAGAIYGAWRIRRHQAEEREAMNRARHERNEAEILRAREELARKRAELENERFDAETRRIRALPEPEQEAAMREFVERHRR